MGGRKGERETAGGRKGRGSHGVVRGALHKARSASCSRHRDRRRHTPEKGKGQDRVGEGSGMEGRRRGGREEHRGKGGEEGEEG